MKYVVIIYGSKARWDAFPAEEWPAAIAAQDAFNARYAASGELLGAFGLGDEQEARTVRVRNGVPAVTDGPYVEAKEYVSSFYLLESADEAEAMRIAGEIPFASHDAVEVWPVRHEAGPAA